MKFSVHDMLPIANAKLVNCNFFFFITQENDNDFAMLLNFNITQDQQCTHKSLSF